MHGFWRNEPDRAPAKSPCFQSPALRLQSISISSYAFHLLFSFQLWWFHIGFASLEPSTSEWTYESVEEREWWADLWADRVLYSEFARQGLEYGLATSEELSEISDSFRAWSDSADGIFVVVHEEVLARK